MKVLSIPRVIPEILPVFLSISIVAWIIGTYDVGNNAVLLVLGIIAGSLTDIDSDTAGRIKNSILILLSFIFSSLVIEFVYPYSLLRILTMTALAFCTTMLGAIDRRYRIIAFGTLLVAMYTLLSERRSDPVWYINPLMIASGAFIYQTLMLLCYWIFPNRPVQEKLSNAFTALSAYFLTKATFFDPDECDQLKNAHYQLAIRTQTVTNAFNECRSALFYHITSRKRLSTRRKRQLRQFLIAQDIHERISAAHVDYHWLSKTLAHSDVIFRIHRLIMMQGKICADCAQTLLKEKYYTPPSALRRAYLGLQAAWDLCKSQQPISESEDVTRLIDNLHMINKHLYVLAQSSEKSDILTAADDTVLDDEHIHTITEIPTILRNNMTRQSPFFRHAIRLSIVSLISCTLTELLQLQMGYWILLTAAFVCQPNYIATRAKLIQRIVGTFLGVIIGSLLPLIAPQKVSILSIIVIANTLFFYFRGRNYGFSTIFITIQLFLNFFLIGIDTPSLIFTRISDTLIGALISWCCISYLWPDWHYLSLDKFARQALESDNYYFALIIAQIRANARNDVQYLNGRRRAHEHAAALATLARDMKNNPEKYGKKHQSAYTLTQLNYQIVGYFSALSIYRGRVQDIPTKTLNQFFTFADELKQLLYGIIHVEPNCTERCADFQVRIKNYEQVTLFHPLARVVKILPQFAILLAQEKGKATTT